MKEETIDKIGLAISCLLIGCIIGIVFAMELLS